VTCVRKTSGTEAWDPLRDSHASFYSKFTSFQYFYLVMVRRNCDWIDFWCHNYV